MKTITWNVLTLISVVISGMAIRSDNAYDAGMYFGISGLLLFQAGIIIIWDFVTEYKQSKK